MRKESRFFIALVPPTPIFEEIMDLKHYFKENYNSKASLNSPPHITLHMPFLWKEEKEEELIHSLSNFAQQFKPCSITLQNFGAFPPRVIYLDVAENKPLNTMQNELLRFCKVKLNLFNANYKEYAYHPHITLAFRDLKKPMFFKAWEEFQNKSFTARFDVEQICLMKHNGKMWEIFRALPLG
jgi:2'-5' RNA ligase